MKLGNLSGVEAWRADDQLPPDTYVMQVIEAEESQSSAGNPQIVLDLRVTAGEWRGAEKRDWVTITESSLGRVVQVLEAFGIEIPEGEFEFKPSDLVGKTAEVVLREETYVVAPEKRKGSDDDGTRTGVKVKGYKPVTPGSDLDNDMSGFDPVTQKMNGQAKEKLPF